MKAFLGTGLLGANFTRALLGRGEQVHVWNRTFSKAKELEQYGAKAFENASEAVRNASIVHVALKDDATVDDALSAAAPGLKAGTIIADHTTISVKGAIKRTGKWKNKGISYQHAPVFMGPSNALKSTGHMLVSGDQDLIKKLEPHLSAMTGKVLNFGSEVGKAAALKLAGNCFLVAFTGAIADLLAFAQSLDISNHDLLQLFSEWNPGTSTSSRIKRITGEDLTQPTWTLNMARKDTGLFLKHAAEEGIELTLIQEVANRMDDAITKGHGQDDWMIFGKPGR